MSTVGSFFIWSSEEKCWDQSLQLGAGRNQSLAVLVALVLLEVLDEAASQILGLLLPLGSVGVGIAGIQDAGVNTVQDGGNLEVEVGDLLGGHVVDIAVQDSVDDATGVLDGDALAVPFQPVLTGKP